MEPFIGQICLFGFPFAPRGWALCNGQVLSIAQNTALFSLIGTTYGGNGQTTFALPNLQGRVAIHQGAGPGLTPRSMGEMGGSESQTLNSSQIPPHTHPLLASANAADTNVPANNALAASAGSLEDGTPTIANTYVAATPNTPLNMASIGANNGGGQPLSIMEPYLVMSYCIALEGIFPSRN